MIDSVKIVFNDLYKRIVVKNSPKYNRLRVITGYSSASFIKKVLNDFPNLELTIYIGMARQGIFDGDHYSYCQLVEGGNAKIYYQVESPDTHQKILEFRNANNDHIGYVGSANFSENGFEVQREAMAIVNEDLTNVFKDEEDLCLLCTDPKVRKLISISKDEMRYHVDMPKKTEHPQNDFNKNSEQFFDNSSYFISEDAEFRYDFKAQLIPDQYDQLDSGINADPSYIYLTDIYNDTLSKKDFFYLNIAGHDHKAYCGGVLDHYIMLRDGNIGNEIRRMLNIPANKKVDLNILKKAGCTKVALSLSGQNKYILELIKEEDK